MSVSLTEKMTFKDFKSAVDFVHKEYYKDFPRYMVEQYVFFGDKYPNIMEKIMTGDALSPEEKVIMDAGKKFKHNIYYDNEVIEDAIDIKSTVDAPKSLVDRLFFDDVKPEDSEKVNPEDVPEAVNNEKIKEIIEAQVLENEDIQ